MFLKCFLIFTMILQIHSEQDRRLITTLKYSKHYMRPAIVNGEPAVSGQIPYMVSIKEHSHKSGNRIVWRSLCGGSIISKSKVVTAAHCFEISNYYYKKHPHLLRIVAGNLLNNVMYTPNRDTSSQWRNIKKLVLHQDFHFPMNDIALIRVDKNWEFGNNVNYIIPARKDMDYPRTCMAAGFGKIKYGARSTTSQVLLLAPIHIMPRSRCSMIWEMNMNRFICSNSMITDVAGGDSGGPLACRWTLDPVERNHRDLLVGVVSGKNFDYTTLFTRVSAYHDWIARGRGCSFNAIPILFSITLLLVKYVEYFCYITSCLLNIFMR